MDTSVEAGTSYKYEIEAYDAEGNTSEISDKLEASTVNRLQIFHSRTIRLLEEIMLY